MQRHKLKVHREEMSLDVKPGKLGIKVEGAERERAKRIIRKELKEYYKEKAKKESIMTKPKSLFDKMMKDKKFRIAFQAAEEELQLEIQFHKEKEKKKK